MTEQISIESQWTEKAFVDPSREPYEAERREAILVRGLAEYLLNRDHKLWRHKIIPPGEAKPLFTDLFDATTNLVVEAKGVATREAVRMAIGQLADYVRFLNNPRCVILLPSKPRDDLAILGHSQGITFVWPQGNGYRASRDDVINLLTTLA